MKRFPRKTVVPFLVVLALLLPLYLATLQTIPNGSEHYYMIDVGETQNVLNLWGTLHPTGYPLYVMIGNVLVALLKIVGVSAAAAPGITSLLYGVIALALIYALGVIITSQTRPWLPALMTLLFGLTRTVWVHHVIAEVYTFGLLFLALLLVIALWSGLIRGRVYWLALIGGMGVAHHRALVMAAPALIYAVWPEIKAALVGAKRRLAPTMLRSLVFLAALLLIGLIGFLPYAYLPARADAGAKWVYGEPGSWSGFLDQFWGREAARFIGAPASWDGLLTNVHTINSVLATDLTLPGIATGLLGLLGDIGEKSAKRRSTNPLVGDGCLTAVYGQGTRKPAGANNCSTSPAGKRLRVAASPLRIQSHMSRSDQQDCACRNSR